MFLPRRKVHQEFPYKLILSLKNRFSTEKYHYLQLLMLFFTIFVVKRDLYNKTS